MKTYATFLCAAFLVIGCSSQENKLKEDNKNEKPRGNWEVNKEYDEAGNLIQYDSVYSWSSGSDIEKLSKLDRDSLIKSIQSKFYRNFSNFNTDGFEELFKEDSLFSKGFNTEEFFESEFGKDFMNIDKLHQRMRTMQKKFLKQYQSKIAERKEDTSENKNK